MPDWSKPTIVGDLVTLRPYAAADFDATWEMVHDAEGNDLTGTVATFTEQQIRDWIDHVSVAEDRLDLVVVDNATGDYAGEVVLNDYDAAAATVNFRIALRGPAWYGRGLGGEATALVCDYAFARLGVERITLDLLARNPRARRAYERAGFVVTREYDDDGERWIDMELTRPVA